MGVDLNTASEQLLTYVSGLGPTLARNIVAHRHENGPFQTRRDLLKVPRLGPKAFAQCSGFLRIRDGKQPLDASAVHPEAYAVVERMAKDTGTTVRELMQSPERRKEMCIRDRGYDGVVVTDDLQMDAIAAEYTLEEVVLRAIGAGADILLFGNNLEYDPAIVAKVQAIIARAVEDGTLSRARLEASWRRIRKLKRQMS